MSTVLIPLPGRDFDPTEVGVPWRLLRVQGHRVVFATPGGRPAQADPKIVTGKGLGIFAPFMKADANGPTAYSEMTQCAEFQGPISYDGVVAADFDALLLPGGHAPGMRPYFESALLDGFDRLDPLSVHIGSSSNDAGEDQSRGAPPITATHNSTICHRSCASPP